MNEIKMKVNKNKIDFISLVGNEILFQDKKILIYDWSNEYSDLGIIIKNDKNQQIGNERISLALGFNHFINRLSEYGFNVIIEENITYSLETIQKAHGLTLAGFSKLVRVEDNYSVDNIFLQTFLLENELQYLLVNNVQELNLIDIK